MLVGQFIAAPVLAASITSAAFSGAAGTAVVSGTLYAKSGSTLTLTAVTDTATNCVSLSGTHSGSSTTPSGTTSTTKTWTFTLSAATGADGARNTTLTAFDGADCVSGSQQSVSRSYVVDNTAPAVSVNRLPTPNGFGWNNSDITLTWTATDSGSGVASGPTPASDGLTVNNTVLKTSSATDRVGNVGTGSIVLKLDKTAPSITGSRNPAANANGWNNTDVTVSFVCSDGDSGIQVCPTSNTTVTGNVSGQPVTGMATDFASNTASATVVVSIDRNAPTLSGAPAGSPNANGWYNSDVTVVWTCSDTGGSGFATGACASSTISTEGTGRTLTRSVTDLAGNSSGNATSSPALNLDKTAPSTTATPATTNGGATVTVTLAATDALSGVASTNFRLDGGSVQQYGPSNMPTFSTSANHSLEYWSTDLAGNAEQHHTLGVAGDTTPPTVTATRAPAPNGNGWNNTNVTVTFTCSDAGSGVASCPSPVTVTGEGANQAVSGTAFDNAGNSAPASVSVSLDKTAPSVSVSGVTAGGTYQQGTWTASCATTDALSGVASQASLATSGGPTGTVTLTCSGASDRAGNAQAAPVSVQITVSPSDGGDTTPPTITATRAPGPNGNGWNNTSVTVTFTCSDAGSGVATCPAPVTVSNEGANQIVSGTAFDKAGNSAQASARVSVDKTAPSVSVSGVTAGGTYQQGAWSASCATTDALSGVATQASLASSGGPTGTVTLTCSGAFDRAGNAQAAPVSVQITVTSAGGSGGFTFGGFLPPVSGDGVVNHVRQGSPVLVRFSLGGFHGMYIFAAGYPASAVSNCSGTPSDGLQRINWPYGAQLWYNRSSDTYGFYWWTQPWWTGCRTLVLKFSDGSTQVAQFYFDRRHDHHHH